jgi:metal-responsive CopG/Arc/MetJ family transcriptional regulator
MKTAISIPDDVFRAAEDAARRNGMSRSQLFTEAVRLFLKTRGGEEVTARLNEVYSQRDSRMDAVLSRMQSAALLEDW